MPNTLPPRKLRRKVKRKKIFLCAGIAALLTTSSAFALVSANSLPLDRLTSIVNFQQAYDTENAAEGNANSAEATAEESTDSKAVESWRTDKNKIWLNPDQAKEGQDAPIFIALCLHEVRNDRPDDALAISTQNFRKIVRELKSQGFWFLDSNDIIAIKKGEMEQPEKAVFLSFDDGYEDNYTNAFPILRQEGVKATFFIVSGSIGKDNRMTVEQLKEMASVGMCFGSHTVNHEELDKLSAEQIKSEMNDSKYVLQHDYGIKVESLAYPCGFQSEAVLKEAQANYEIAFTANMDEKTPDTAYTIHRYGVFRWNDSLASIMKN